MPAKLWGNVHDSEITLILPMYILRTWRSPTLDQSHRSCRCRKEQEQRYPSSVYRRQLCLQLYLVCMRSPDDSCSNVLFQGPVQVWRSRTVADMISLEETVSVIVDELQSISWHRSIRCRKVDIAPTLCHAWATDTSVHHNSVHGARSTSSAVPLSSDEALISNRLLTTIPWPSTWCWKPTFRETICWKRKPFSTQNWER